MKHSAESTHPGCPALRYIGRFFAVLGILLLAVALLLTGAVALTCKGPSPTARDLLLPGYSSTIPQRFCRNCFCPMPKLTRFCRQIG